MRLQSGQLFPLPVTLPIEASPALHLDCDIALRDAKNDLLAVMTLEEIYLGSPKSRRKPLVRSTCVILWSRRCSAGGNSISPGRVLQLPKHYDFQELRLTPAQTRARLEGFGYAHVVAFQTVTPCIGCTKS